MSKEAVEQAREFTDLEMGVWESLQALDDAQEDFASRSEVPVYGARAVAAFDRLEAAIREDAVREWREAVERESDEIGNLVSVMHRRTGDQFTDDIKVSLKKRLDRLRSLLDREKEG